MEPPTPTTPLIETADELRLLSARLSRASSLAVDLEADSLFHYREKICLIQIGDGDGCYLLDPLTIGDCSSLGPFFQDGGIRKIFHGADYDIRSLFRDFGFTVHNLFDTELAARFLGFKETGLEALLAATFQVQLNKRFQRTDWSKRPLTPDMLEYAAADVAHLIPLARYLEEKLTELGRLEWVREECEWLCRARPQAPYEGPLFLRFKGARTMEPRTLGVLESLLHYRLSLAEEKDRPVFKVLGADPLGELALKKPESREALQGIKGLSPKMIGRMGEGLLAAVRRGLEKAESDLPRFPRTPKPPTPYPVTVRIKALKRWRETKSAELALDPGLLLNNAQIDLIARQTAASTSSLEQLPELKNWQKKVFGEEIIRALS